MRSPGLPHSALVLLLLTAPLSGSAQSTPPGTLPADPQLREAFLAWDRGEYPQALRSYLEALEGAGPDRVREVAALTGEVFRVTEVAPDGGRVRVDPQGGFATFEVDAGEGVTRTRVFDARSGAAVATLAGFGAVPGPGGQVAFLAQRSVPPEVAGRVEAAQAALRSGDRRGYFARMREAAWFRMTGLEVRIQDMGSGASSAVELDGVLPGALAWDDQGALLVSGVTRDGQEGALVRVRSLQAERLGLPDGFPGAVLTGRSGTVVVEMSARPVLPTPPGADLPARGMDGVAVIRDARESVLLPDARDPVVSRDGSVLAHLRSMEGRTEVRLVELDGELASRTVWVTEHPLDALAVSPSGAHVAFQQRPLHDWEVYAVPTSGPGDPVRLTHEIQHDRGPVWVDDGTVLAAKGEGRHMRSWLYHLDGSPPLKLFHNNTVRTIAPEYEWAVVPGGERILVVSERDGDTVSPERGVYLVDLTRPVSREELVARLERALAAEEDLRRRGVETFAPVRDQVQAVAERVQVERVSARARDLYLMGSKHITRPGNRLAIDYLQATLLGWGYEPELQWFEPRPGLRTANVVVRIPGRVDPGLVYVVSSHFDSVERGPGADDNSSGTTALLEVARVLRDRRLPATVELAFFTGEEAGLLGSREYVRRAVEEGKHIVGALNNDMLGWANDHRLDNTIRYSNPGIRDVQHGAALLFSDLITYDALYYKSTDAAAYYEAYGDIVGGIGSYPVLGNPHYHQSTDELATIDHRLVAEVARTTAATVMLLASAPSRVRNLTARAGADGTVVSWDASPESEVVEYTVRWTDGDGPPREETVRAGDGARPQVRLPGVSSGTDVAVRAVNRRGLHGWDWARGRVVGGG